MPEPVADASAADAIEAPPSAARATIVGRVARVLAGSVVPSQFAYAVVISVVFVLFRTLTDKVGWVTILAYGPRWVWLVPAVALALAALLLRRSPAPAIITIGMVLGPLMDANVPYGGHLARRGIESAGHLRLMSFNVGQGSGMVVDRARIRDAIVRFSPDVVVFQELGAVDLPTNWPGQWYVTKSRKGAQVLLIASRLPMEEQLPPGGVRTSGVLTETAHIRLKDGRGLWVVAPHVRSPRFGFEPVLKGTEHGWDTLETVMDVRETQLQKVRAFAGPEARRVVIVGDFNTVADSPILRDTMTGLRSAFNDAAFGYGNTKLTRGWGVRIDHVFTGPGVRATACEVGPDLGSDHRPLIVDLNVAP